MSRSMRNDVRAKSPDRVYRFGAVGGLTDELELRVQLEEGSQTIPHNLMIVCNEDSYRH